MCHFCLPRMAIFCESRCISSSAIAMNILLVALLDAHTFRRQQSMSKNKRYTSTICIFGSTFCMWYYSMPPRIVQTFYLKFGPEGWFNILKQNSNGYSNYVEFNLWNVMFYCFNAKTIMSSITVSLGVRKRLHTFTITSIWKLSPLNIDNNFACHTL